jgi:hypothetical protein
MRQMTPVMLPESVSGAEGKWIALKDGEIVAMEETPAALYAWLHQRRITGTTVLRIPDEGEAELVGLG